METVRKAFLKKKLYIDIFQIIRKMTRSILLSLTNIPALCLNIVRSSYSFINKIFKFRQNCKNTEEEKSSTSFIYKAIITLITVSGIAAIMYNSYIVAIKTLALGNIKNAFHWIICYLAGIALFEIFKNINYYLTLRNDENETKANKVGIKLTSIAGLVAAALIIAPKWIIIKQSLSSLLSHYIHTPLVVNIILYSFLVINTLAIIFNSIYDMFPCKSSNETAEDTTSTKSFKNYITYFFLIIFALVNAAGIFLFEYQSLKLVFEPQKIGFIILIVALAGFSAAAVLMNWIDLYLYSKDMLAQSKEPEQTPDAKTRTNQKPIVTSTSIKPAPERDEPIIGGEPIKGGEQIKEDHLNHATDIGTIKPTENIGVKVIFT